MEIENNDKTLDENIEKINDEEPELIFDEEKEEKENIEDDENATKKSTDADLLDIFGEISDDEEEEVVEDYEYPKFSKPTGEIIKLKLPDSINIIPTPYEAGSDNNLVKKPTIRFKYILEQTKDGEDYKKDENGEFMTESNCKIVKFSDGSNRMYVGKEFYDVLNFKVRNNQRNSHVFVGGDYNDESFIESGKIKESWKIKSKFGSDKIGFGYGDSYKRRTKLTDVKLDKEFFYDQKPKKLSIDKEIKALKAIQRKKMRKAKRMNKEFLEDEDGVSIKQLKKDIRRGKRRKKRKRKKKKRIKKSKDDYENDEFIADEEDYDDDEEEEELGELGEDEFDEEDEDESEEDFQITGKKRKRRRRGKKKKGDSSSDEEILKKELVLYDDESGSDSDETYRPFSPKKKKRKK